MKKVLSVILAVIMLAMCVPVASAVDYDVFDAFMDEYGRYYANINNVYDNPDSTDDIQAKCYELVGKYEWTKDFMAIESWMDENEESLPSYTEDLRKVNEEVEKYICEKYTLIIDIENAFDVILKVLYYSNYDIESESFKNYYIENFGKEPFEKAYKSVEDAYYLSGKAVSEPGSVTQADYDEATAYGIEFFSDAIECMRGNHTFAEYTDLGDGTHKADCTFCKSGEIIEAHTWGEYTPNGDATTEADGTKTAKCDKCDATDTVADEGSKLVEDIAQGNFFNNIVDKIMSFFESIINFFKNLFN